MRSFVELVSVDRRVTVGFLLEGQTLSQYPSYLLSMAVSVEFPEFERQTVSPLVDMPGRHGFGQEGFYPPSSPVYEERCLFRVA